MANSLFQQLNPQGQAAASKINPQAIQGVKQLINMFKCAGNPNQIMQTIMSQNPQIAQVMSMLKGRNAQQFFYEECKREGIDPNEIINQLK